MSTLTKTVHLAGQDTIAQVDAMLMPITATRTSVNLTRLAVPWKRKELNVQFQF